MAVTSPKHLPGLSYTVFGVERRVTSEEQAHRRSRIRHLEGQIMLKPAGLENYSGLDAIDSLVLRKRN